MIEHYWHKFIYWLGYRRVLYLPSNHGIAMGDFYGFVYRPDLPKLYYTEYTLPRKVKI